MGCGCALCPGAHGNVKLRASVISGILFAVIASPQLFAFMQKLLGGVLRVTSPTGVPTLAGVLLHAVVFGLVVYLFMHNKKRRPYNLRQLGPQQLGPQQLAPQQLGPQQLGPQQLAPRQYSY